MSAQMRLPIELKQMLAKVALPYKVERTANGHFKITNTTTGAFAFVSGTPRSKSATPKVLRRDLRRIELM